MKINSLQAREYVGSPKEWRIGRVDFAERNLLVGRNASGKSHILNNVFAVAKAMCGRQRPLFSSVEFQCNFSDGSSEFAYELRIQKRRVIREMLRRDDQLLLQRRMHGYGKIYYEKDKVLKEFQTPSEQVALFARQDRTQHSFLAPLFEWASSCKLYQFGTYLGKDTLVAWNESQEIILDPSDTKQVVTVFLKGVSDFKRPFVKSIIRDMAAVGYDLQDIGVMTPESIIIALPAGRVVYLYIKEKDLRARTEQNDISQGMFRALSVIIQLNYGRFSEFPQTLLIDDIGEGLDFERSSLLIKLLVDKAVESKSQLIMTTNDRFIMNAVPLEYWSVVGRKRSSIAVSNYKNSKKKFDEFKFTGLNNFDFFATDFVSSDD